MRETPPPENAGAAGILVFGYGNPSRGDDALGPLLIERLESLLGKPDMPPEDGVECLTDFQLQIEHALDLRGRRRVLFVDAHVDCEPPWRLTRLRPERDASYSTHAISPSSVLRVYQDYFDQQPPPSFLLGIRGERFELGEPLSPAASRHLDEALTLVLALCRQSSEALWRSQCQDAAPVRELEPS
ncbi:MAG: hydrogenase maturation protease [Methylococcus sp.]|nr:MAG: hydrogenase maturation protease [Methylococcus sp.]